MRLSDLVAHAELSQDSAGAGTEATAKSAVIAAKARKRLVDPTHIEDDSGLLRLTGLSGDVIASAIESTYLTLDMIDRALVGRSSPRSRGWSNSRTWHPCSGTCCARE